MNESGDQPACDRLFALAIMRLSSVVHQYRTTVGRDRYGVDTNGAMALILLHVDGPLTPRQVSAGVNLTPAATTEMLDRLERAGFLTRAPHPTDRRKLVVSATTAGHELVDREWTEFTDLIRPALPRGDHDGQRMLDSVGQLIGIVELANTALDTHAADTRS